jgi:hypothetical protein
MCAAGKEHSQNICILLNSEIPNLMNNDKKKTKEM